MNVLICDDQEAEAARLKKLLGDSGFELTIAAFNNGFDALDYIQSGTAVDVCFLDIIMPGLSGIKLAEELRADGYAGEIVFLSNARGYGPETYMVHAFSYLLKPIQPDAVRDILQKLENKKKKEDTAGIFIKASKVARYVLLRDISYIEARIHYVHFRLTGGEEIAIYATFSGIAEKVLADSRFAHCHRSYIVNMEHIDRIDERLITMRDGEKVPYSRNNSDIKKRFTKWIAEGAK